MTKTGKALIWWLQTTSLATVWGGLAVMKEDNNGSNLDGFFNIIYALFMSSVMLLGIGFATYEYGFLGFLATVVLPYLSSAVAYMTGCFFLVAIFLVFVINPLIY